MTLLWGCNWPILKMGVSELAPLTFRSLTLPFAGLGLLLVARLAGEPIRVARRHWAKLALLALFNIAGWNGFILFGVQQLSSGRSAILAYTMPLWATLCAAFVLHEPLSRRKVAGLALGMMGMALLIGDQVRVLKGAPLGVMMILIAALSWGFGTALMRKWPLPVAQSTLTGWMMLLGWVPLVILVPAFDPQPLAAELGALSSRGWFAIVYNIVFAGTLANWAWFTLARRLPVAVSSLSSLPIPVVGVFSGMALLGERPGATEWVALAFVVAALFVVMFRASPGTDSGAPSALHD
ncbi:MAG TPA: EamA family transporter [Casimicrobiaceae bacterium]|nr:EamA family transporter [Casimicrobiaceae bacterium]